MGSGLFGGRSAVAEPEAVPTLSATLDCREEPGTGRLVCAVSLAVAPGTLLRWSDALVVSAPESARPLRARVQSGADPARLVLGFVLAPGAGGRIEIVARAVTCSAPRSGAGSCRTSTERLAHSVSAR